MIRNSLIVAFLTISNTVSFAQQFWMAEDQAYNLLIKHIISKGIASSCSALPNNIPKDNISVYDKTKSNSKSGSYGKFKNISSGRPFYFYHILIKVCRIGNLGAISYGQQDWAFIQDGRTGVIYDEFSTFRKGVNTYLVKSLYELRGQTQIDNSVSKNENINENLFLDARFPGGEREWLKFISFHLEQNIQAIEKDGRSGNLVILLNIDKDGTVNEVRAVPCSEANVSNCVPPESKLFEVVINAIFKGPKWEPGVKKGIAVKSQIRLELPFYLNED